MGKPHLLFRERQGLATIIAVTLQCALDRTPVESDPEPILREIESAVRDAIADIRHRFGSSLSSTSSSGSLEVQTPSDTTAVEVRSPVKIIRSRPAKLHVITSPAVDRIPTDVLRMIMLYLPRTTGIIHSCFADLTIASSVCRRWRALALSTPRLWSTIYSPSMGELDELATIVLRTSATPMHVDLDLRDMPVDLQERAITILTDHMHHMKVLILRYNSDYEEEQERLLLSMRAPHLQDLRLYSARRIQLRSNFLGGRAPALTTLAMTFLAQLPPSCPGLASVTTLHILHHPHGLSADDACNLFKLCPRLASVRLDGPLRCAPTTGSVAGLRGLRALNVPELGTDGAAQTLRAFDVLAVADVHVRGATTSTAGFLNKELKGIKHLCFLRAGGARPENAIVLRDQDDRQHTMSRLTVVTLDYALRKAWLSSWQFTSLCMSECIAASDAEALSDQCLPSLRSLSIFIAGKRHDAPHVHIFDLYAKTHKEWAFPALATLTFDARAPIRDCELFVDPPPARTAISAADILRFFRDVLYRAVEGKPVLVMHGVSFRERFAGPEVAALYTNFSEITLYQ